MPAIDLSILNQRQTPAFYADVFANRPAAGFVGRIFVSTNTFAFYRDNGTGWDLIGGPGSGTITGSGSFGSIALWNGTDTITYDVGLTWDGTANSLTASKFIVTGGTSSQFLKGDGSLDSNTYNTGSGAVGQVTFWNGTNAITGGNDLFWDSANGHLGVNTNVPGTALDVHHDQPTVAILNQTVATNDVRIGFQNNGVGLWRIGAFYNAGANDFGIYDAVAAIQPVTVKKTTGQVLIGTSTVGSGKLVVASTTGDNGIQIVGATAPSLRIDSAESGPTKRAGLGISTATNNFIQGSADRDFCIFNGSTAAASPILFGIYDAAAVNVQEAARISAARNFLIGTTTDAGYKLFVNGTSQINGELTLSAGLLSLSGSAGSPPTSGVGFRYVSNRLIIYGGSADITFQKNNNTGSNMIILDSGNVGIGTATPAYKLDVTGVVASNTGFLISSGQYSNITEVPYTGIYMTGSSSPDGFGSLLISSRTDAARPIIFGTSSGSASAERMRIAASTGNLLIGTTTDAGERLQINGGVRISGNNPSLRTDNTTDYTTLVSYLNNNRSWQLDNVTNDFKLYITGSVNNYIFTVKSTGIINLQNVPTSPVGLVSGDIYRTGNVLNIV